MNAPHFNFARHLPRDPDPGHLLTLLELGTEDEPMSARPSSAPGAGGGLIGGTTEILEGLHRASRRSCEPQLSTPRERRVGPYFLIERLGQGSQAEVWKAVQVAPKLAPVALRMLIPEHAGISSQRDAFLRTARLSRRLPSPPWLPTLDYGEADGCVYQTMPLVEGGTLADAIESRRLGPGATPASQPAWWDEPDVEAYLNTVVRLMAQVARAVAVAHNRRVVHRDLKPGNLLLDRFRRDTIFVGDLGIGRELGDDGIPSASGLVGTLMYMAPERLLNEPADERLADIYALGVTMYEALTLVHPWQVPEGIPRSCLPAFVANNPIPRPRLFRPELSKALESIITRALARDPAARHPSASALARDLERIVWGKTDADVAARPRRLDARHFPSRSHLLRKPVSTESAGPPPLIRRAAAPHLPLPSWLRRTLASSR